MATDISQDQKTYIFDVKMTCGGCSGAVSRALGKLDGLDGYEVHLEKQEVIVRSKKVSYEEVLEKIKKTGKEVRSGKAVDSAGTEISNTEPVAPAVPTVAIPA